MLQRMNPRLRGGLPPPKATNFSYAQVSSLIGGPVRVASGNQIRFGRSGFTSWTGRITGEEAYFIANSGWGATNLLWVSIDGAAEVNISPVTGTRFRLFQGAYGTRVVTIRISDSQEGEAYVLTTGAVLEVWGRGSVRPATVALDNLTSVGAGPSGTWTGAFTTPAAINSGAFTNFPQTPIPIAQGITTAIGSSCVPAIRFRTTATRLTFVHRSRFTYVSIDGAAPTIYTTTPNLAQTLRSSVIVGPSQTPRATESVNNGLDGNAHDIAVWIGAHGTNFYGSPLHVYSNAPYLSQSTVRRWDQFGDSITAGYGISAPSNVEIFRVASALGGVGAAHGITGETVGGLNSRLTTLLASYKPFVANTDVAVLAIGRNDVGMWNSTTTSNYQSCITQLLAKGYGRVIPRALIRTNSEYWPTENALLIAAANALGDSRVRPCDTVSWTGVSTTDNVHPNDAGYDTLATHATRDYPALAA